MQTNLLTLLLILLTTAFCQQTTADSIKSLSPVKILSVSVNRDLLYKNIKNHQMTISQNLDVSTQVLTKCKVIGGISQLNLKNNPTIQFHFTYKLHANNSTLSISIFYRQLTSHQLTQSFLVVMDFLIAEFPPEYFITIFNITSYQQHLTHANSNKYDMLFFLNGWNNLTISGNVTHSYQVGADVYTIHYMSCEGEMSNMGYNQGHDYLLYTFVIVPYELMKQKFKLTDKTFNLDYLSGYKYFYGIKGTTQEQFVGSFHQRLGGVLFKAQNLGKYLTYGLAYLAYPYSQQLSDSRIHKSYNSIIIVIIFSVSLLILLFLCYIFRRKIFSKNYLNEQKDYLPDITEQTKNDIKVTDISRVKYDLNTVAQVDQRYECSLKNSYQPKIHQQPSISLKD